MAELLFLVRHGEAEGARPGRLLGRTDSPLSETGRAQSRLIRDALPMNASARFLCSPLGRAMETAEIVLAGRDAVLEVDPDLREIDFGVWEGLTYREVAKDHPALAEAWSEFRPEFSFPEGEGLGAFRTRIEGVAGRLAATDAQTVTAFSHGGVIRALICHFLGLPLRDYLLFDIRPASVAALRLEKGRGTLWSLRQVDGLSLWPGV